MLRGSGSIHPDDEKEKKKHSLGDVFQPGPLENLRFRARHWTGEFGDRGDIWV
jgi:hypothetical protein